MPGDTLLVRLGERPIAVFNVAGELHVVDDLCTHAKASLSAEGSLDGDIVVCGRHGARFHLPTGEVRCPPAVKPLRTYDVVIDGDDVYLAEADLAASGEIASSSAAD